MWSKLNLIPTALLISSSINIWHTATPIILTIVVSFLVLFNNAKIDNKFHNVIVFVSILLLLPIPIFNGSNLYNVTASVLRFIAFYLLVNLRLNKKIEIDAFKGIYEKWLIMGAIYFAIISIFYQEPDSGAFMPRYSSYMFDSNYFSILALGLFITLKNNDKSKRVYLLPIICAQSLTVITGFLIGLLLNSRIKVILSYGLATFPLLIYLIFVNFEIDLDQSLVEEEIIYILQRGHSVMIRYTGWHGALDSILDSPTSILFGIGSGRSYEFGQTVLHSYYIQTLVDKGILGYLILTMYIYNKLKSNINLLFLFAWTSMMLDSYALLSIGYLIFINNNLKIDYQNK